MGFCLLGIYTAFLDVLCHIYIYIYINMNFLNSRFYRWDFSCFSM
jgi:hypothetical protein